MNESIIKVASDLLCEVVGEKLALEPDELLRQTAEKMHCSKETAALQLVTDDYQFVSRAVKAVNLLLGMGLDEEND